MADNFFEEPKVEEQTTEEQLEKIKLGEKEYTQDELSQLVGLGESARDLEEKWNTKIDRLMPEYTKATQEVKTLKEAMEKFPKQQTAPSPDGQRSEEEVREEIQKEMAKYGYVPESEVRKIANEVLAWNKLNDQVDGLVERHKAEGNPAITKDELFEFMNEKRIIDPDVAYKIKFEKELDAIKERKLASLKPSGLMTESASTAGSKQPQPVRPTKNNIGDLIEDVMSRYQ